MCHGLGARRPANHREAGRRVQVHAQVHVRCALVCACLALLGHRGRWLRCMKSVSWSCLRNRHCRRQHRRWSHWRRQCWSRSWLLVQVHSPLMLLQAIGQEAPNNHLKTMVHVRKEISIFCSDELRACSLNSYMFSQLLPV